MRAGLALLLTASLVRADPAQYMQGDVLQAEIRRVCGGGCVVFAPHEIEAMQAQINAEVQRREQAAFERGRKSERESCRNLIIWRTE